MPYPRLKQPENFESTRAMGLSRANTETFLLESLFWIIDSNLSCTFQCMEKSQSFIGQNINLNLKHSSDGFKSRTFLSKLSGLLTLSCRCIHTYVSMQELLHTLRWMLKNHNTFKRSKSLRFFILSLKKQYRFPSIRCRIQALSNVKNVWNVDRFEWWV